MTEERLLLKVTCPPHHADLIADVLMEAGSEGVEERDATTMTVSSASETEIIAGFDTGEKRTDAAAAVAALPLDPSEIRIEQMDPLSDDWKIKWREFFQPQVLSILQVITPWMSPPRDDRISIVIDPGQAFGTGGHATTRLILEMMEHRAETSRLPAEAADIGSGSGILAIAARKLGISKVTGVDIEAEAVTAFFENAERNGVTDGLDCRLGTVDALSKTYPLVLANIQIDVFRVLAKDIAAIVAADGEVLISGILLEQVEECIALWPGFQVTEQREDGEWAALALKRNP